MTDKMTPAERRLYLWLRAVSALTLVASLAFTTLALVLLPAFVSGYSIGESTVVVIYGTLTTAIAALLGVEIALRRNGNGK